MGPAAGTGSRISSSTRRSTCNRPLPGGIVRWLVVSKRIAPTRLPRRVSRRARVVTKSISTVRLTRAESSVPKSTEGLRSSRNQAVRSRSSA